MRLTRAGEYAVRAVLYLAKQKKGTLVSSREIATRTDVPAHFLAKIAQQLAKAGIIEIQQGSGGGFRLRQAPADLPLLTVIEAIIGEISLNDCVTRPDSCTRSALCAVHRVWNRANEQLRATLRETTFAELAAEENCCLADPLLPVAGNRRPRKNKE